MHANETSICRQSANSVRFWRFKYGSSYSKTSSARGDTICPRHAAAHLQSIAYTPYACGAQRALRHVNIHVRQAAARSGRWRTVDVRYVVTWTANQSGYLDLRPFDPESGVWVTCDVSYLCANFSLLCSRLRPDVRDRRQTDRQTDRRQTKASLNAPPIRGGA